MNDFEFEPVKGLPTVLPPGERILWQGAPDWRRLSKGAFRLRVVTIYFALLLLWRLAALHADAASGAWRWIGGCLPLMLTACATVAMLSALAWLSARATVYTITDRRVVIRQGIALSLTLNVPFSAIKSAAVARSGDGSGTIAIELAKGSRVGYLLNWPHVRPGYFTQPQPALRAVATIDEPAHILAHALARGSDRVVDSPQASPLAA